MAEETSAVLNRRCVCAVCRRPLSGKQLPAVTVTMPTSRSSRSNTPRGVPSHLSSTPRDPPHLDDEITSQDEDVEEILAIDSDSLAGSV